MNHKSFKATLVDFFLKQKYCDLHFTIKNPDGSCKKIGAHKLILSAASEMFEKMFFEQQVEKNVSKINVTDIGAKAIMFLLNFIYQIDVNFEKDKDLTDPEIVTDLYRAAHRFSCTDALAFVTNLMLKNVNVNNAILFYETAVLYDNLELKNVCMKVFMEKTKEVLSSNNFLASNSQTVETIFKMEQCKIDSEIALVRALERYFDHHKDSQPNIAVKLRPALNCIRFLTLTPTEIAETELLTAEEVRNIIRCLPADKDLSNMPVGLSLNRSARSRLTREEMERSLMKVNQNSNICNFCHVRSYYYQHSLWNCPEFDGRDILQQIFQKYHHKQFSQYTAQDLQRVYDICKDFLNIN